MKRVKLMLGILLIIVIVSGCKKHDDYESKTQCSVEVFIMESLVDGTLIIERSNRTITYLTGNISPSTNHVDSDIIKNKDLRVKINPYNEKDTKVELDITKCINLKDYYIDGEYIYGTIEMENTNTNNITIYIEYNRTTYQKW